MPDFRSVNIARASSAEGLLQDLTAEARKRGRILTRFVGAIYEYAVDHRQDFQEALSQERRKPGDHIGAKVKEKAAKDLSDWAAEIDTSRGLLCCYILEKCVEDRLFDQIFRNKSSGQ